MAFGSTTSHATAQRKGVFLFSSPRTASNLLIKMLSMQEGVVTKIYAYEEGSQESMEVAAENSGAATEAEKDLVLSQFRTEFVKLQTDLANVSNEGKTFLVKDHVSHLVSPREYWPQTFEHFDIKLTSSSSTPDSQPDVWSSGTIYPDAFLLRWTPVFLIRHPALAFPSLLRLIWGHHPALPKLLADAFFNYRFTRQLYEWYTAQLGDIPQLIIDADQLMDPEDRSAITALCSATGFDEERVLYDWEPATAEEKAKSPYKRIWPALKTIKESSGIVSGLTSRDLQMEDEVEKWKVEFGDEWSQILKGYVDSAMEDYEWLKQRRIQKS